MSNLKFSVVVPVYNRPDEVDELLQSLVNQTVQPHEIIIVEDGSTIPCKQVIEKYTERLAVLYFEKTNTGPGLTRNYGAERATGNYLVFFDSDCIIPPRYFENVLVGLQQRYTDAYGGPDMAHESFTPLQKAINYSMTSFLTTGGIRGGKASMEKFHPRSFNMGFSVEVYQKTGGFSAMRFGEDIDMSIRTVNEGFKAQLIPDAGVYHKRRTDFRKFWKQVFNSGIARINLYKRHPQSLKLVHLLPAVFTIGCIKLLFLSLWQWWFVLPLLFYVLMLFVHSLVTNKSFLVALLSVPAAFVQLCGYGTGFLTATWYRLVLQRKEFHAFGRTFYD